MIETNTKLERVLNEKIAFLIRRMGDYGHRRYVPPRIEIRACNADSYDSIVVYKEQQIDGVGKCHCLIFYFDSKKWADMLPITRTNKLRELIISAIQQLYYKSTANNPDRMFIYSLLKGR